MYILVDMRMWPIREGTRSDQKIEVARTAKDHLECFLIEEIEPGGMNSALWPAQEILMKLLDYHLELK